MLQAGNAGGTSKPKTVKTKAMDGTRDRHGELVRISSATPFSTDFPPPQLEQDVEIIDGNNAKILWKISSGEQSQRFEICWWTDETDKRSDHTRSMKYVMSKLKYGSKYFVNVSLASSGAGGVSRSSNTVCFDTAPLAPTNFKVVNYQASPEDSFIVSFDDGNEKKTKHLVIVESLSGQEKPIEKETENCKVLIQGLPAGKLFSVSVISKAEGTNGKMLQSKRTSYDRPVATYPARLQEVNLKLDNERLVLIWNRPKIRPERYEVHWSANGVKHVNDTKDESFFVEGLTPSTTYRFRVAAVNSAGCGDFSEEKQRKTAPAAPVNVCVRKNAFSPEQSFVVTFEDPDPSEKSYKVTAMTMEQELGDSVTTTSKSAVLNKLKPGHPYYIYVIAIAGGQQSERAFYLDHK